MSSLCCWAAVSRCGSLASGLQPAVARAWLTSVNTCWIGVGGGVGVGGGAVVWWAAVVVTTMLVVTCGVLVAASASGWTAAAFENVVDSLPSRPAMVPTEASTTPANNAPRLTRSAALPRRDLLTVGHRTTFRVRLNG